MKKVKLNILVMLGIVAFFASCDSDDSPAPTPPEMAQSFIINYGSFSGDKSTISQLDVTKDSVSNFVYKLINGVALTSNVQYAYQYGSDIYLMGNNTDQIIKVDAKTFEQEDNAYTSDDLVKPRYCVANGDILYISCWGGEIWKDENISYIAKFNVSKKVFEGKIALPGGPEGLAIANGKLYAALNYKDSIAVIDLDSDNISYIVTPAVTSYFIKDKDENLYVSLISTYSDFSTETGIGYINTSTVKLDTVYKKTGISSAYANIMSFNTDESKLYVMAASYDANWNLVGAIEVFDATSKSWDAKPLVSDVTGINGIGFESETNSVVCFVSESTTASGLMKTYDESGKLRKTYTTGISPFMMLTVR